MKIIGKIFCVLVISMVAASLCAGIGTVQAYDSHDQIRITCDNDWEDQNWPGAGTSRHPYIIEDLEIDGTYVSYSYAIYISDTDKYFHIQDCYLHDIGAGDAIGIRLENVAHGLIINNIIEDCDGYGVYLDEDTWSNYVYLNDFLDNNGVPWSNSQAFDDDTSGLTPNLWHAGSTTGGNHWSEHYCVGNPSNGWFPYDIDGAGNSQDVYPYANTIN